MKELISVIIPVYKVEAYLGRCVDSVLAQTYENLEILLVDDGSPDGCPAICDGYARQDARVRVIHQENKGLSGARNAGMDVAKGAYFVFVDSDDYVTPDFVERLYDAVVRTGSQIGICRWQYVHGTELLEEWQPLEGNMTETEPDKLHVYDRQGLMANLYIPDGAYYVVAWNKLYKRELWDGIRYPLGRIHEDEATTHKIFHRAERGVFVDVPMYGYFVAPASITRGFNPKRLDWITGVYERLAFLEEQGYEELMPRALQAFADGMIDIYFGLVDYQAENKTDQKRIRGLVRQGLGRVKAYGSFPLRTVIGYWLFILVPGIYRKLLDRVKSENGKQ